MSEPIRVLRVVGKMDRGGLETIIMNTYRIIDRTKIQFDFVVHAKEKGLYDDEIKNLGGKIFYIEKYKGNNHFRYKKKWTNFLKNHEEYKVIHGHIRSTASIYLKIAKKFGLITIAHSHNISSGKNIAALSKDYLQKRIRYIADYFLACSTPAGKWLFGNDIIKQSNFKVIPNGIDVRKYAYNPSSRVVLRKKYHLEEDNIVIGNIGRFHPQKNHRFLLMIFKEVVKMNPKAKLMIVGDGSLRSEIEKRIKDYGLTDNVLLLGVRDDVPDLLQIMDVFLFPSLFEGFGNVVVEAQSSGLPCVISTNIPLEVKLTSLVECIDLKNSSKFWANKVIEVLSGFCRDNTEHIIIEKGFDIHPITIWYDNFYTSLNKGEKVEFNF
jgi:glycosyltransferase involved in cell wall biosynthesis